MNAGRTCQLCDALDAAFDFLCRHEHQIRQLIDDDDDACQLLMMFLRMCFHIRIVRSDVADARFGKQLIAFIHHLHDDLQRTVGLFPVRDDRCQQMRYLVVRGKFYFLRIDQQHLHLIRSGTHQDRADDRIDAHGFSAAGGTGYQQMRHLVELAINGIAHQIHSQTEQQTPVRHALRDRTHHLLEVHRRLLFIRNLDADRALAGNRRFDADVLRRQRHLNVILQIADLIDSHAKIRPHLKLRDARTDVRAHQRRLDPELFQDIDQLPAFELCRLQVRRRL